jgi:hypothetical protein
VIPDNKKLDQVVASLIGGMRPGRLKGSCHPPTVARISARASLTMGCGGRPRRYHRQR